MAQMITGIANLMAQKSKPALLVVDDDPLIAEALAFSLADDYVVRFCESRAAAIKLLQGGDFSPQLALIDLGLPPLPNQPTEGFKPEEAIACATYRGCYRKPRRRSALCRLDRRKPAD